MAGFDISQSTLCSWLWNREDASTENIEIIMENIIKVGDHDENKLAQIRKKIKNNFLPAYLRKWNSVSRIRERFINNHQQFLNNKFQITFTSNELHVNETLVSAIPSTSNTSTAKGCPRVPYDEASESTKRRRIQEIRSTFSAEELKRAAEINNPQNNAQTSDNILNNKVKDDLSDKILAMYMDLNLTKRKYDELRIHNKVLFDKIYPPYPFIVSAKKRCYPDNMLQIKVYVLNCNLCLTTP